MDYTISITNKCNLKCSYCYERHLNTEYGCIENGMKEKIAEFIKSQNNTETVYLFGGEPLRSGGQNPAKSKTADERELFIEGNLIKAKRTADSENSDEGVIPSEWELIRHGTDGSDTVLAHGIMDYVLLDSGIILYSDGRFVKRLSGGKAEKICRIDFANYISVIE